MDLLKKVRRQTQSTQLLMRWLVGLIVVSTLILVFTMLAEDVWFQEGFSWDAPIILAIHSLGNPILDTVMRFITQTGETGAIMLTIILASRFVWKHKRVEAISTLIAFVGAMGINTLLKLLFERPRPHLFPPLVVESGFSFPSGHVTASVATYGFLAFLLWQNRYRIWAMLSVMWVILVAISRVYLGVHYPSDTLAAIVFATLWVMIVLGAQRGYLNQLKQASP